MKTLRSVVSLCALLLLSACSGSVVVPPPALSMQNALSPMPGKYVAHVQSGAWKLKTKASGFACGGWSFDTDVDAAFVETMKNGLTQAIGNVEFVEAPLDPPDMVGKGYTAQIVIYQGSGNSAFMVNSGMFSATTVTNMELASNIAITDTKGMSNQFAVNGKGMGSADFVFCGDADRSIIPAGQAAISDVVTQSLLYVRDGLHTKYPTQTKSK